MKSATRSWRFLVIGDVGGEATFHLGDEAMLEANVERLKALYPDAQITVASSDPTWSSNAYDVNAVPRVELGDMLAGITAPRHYGSRRGDV